MTPATFKAHRREHGSQRAVARQMGIGFRTLQRIEDGTLGDLVPKKYQTLLNALSTTTKDENNC